MVNCSNCDCSTRNCSTLLAANQLLDTKNEIARISLTGFSSSFIFCVQTNNCSTVICSTLLAGKQQLLDTIYSKENGVHVRQLGQVDMYGSQVRCQVRLGQVRLGQVIIINNNKSFILSSHFIHYIQQLNFYIYGYYER